MGVRTDMPWPLVLGTIKVVDEGDREVITTAEVVAMHQDVAAGMAADSITSSRHNTGSSTNRRNNQNGSIRRSSNHNNHHRSSRRSSNSNNLNSSSMTPGNSVSGAGSLGTSQPIAWHPCQCCLLYTSPSPRDS